MDSKTLFQSIISNDGGDYVNVTEIAKATLVCENQIYAAYTRTFLARECSAETLRLMQETEGGLLIPLHLAEFIVREIMGQTQLN